ncbi:MAG: hypothetical protein QM754_14375 [Tepidisphaeraceae bacterium]
MVVPTSASTVSAIAVPWRAVLRLGHHRDFELLQSFGGGRDERHAAAELDHEIDVLRRDGVARDHEVALIFPVLVVDNDDHSAGFKFFNRFRNRSKRHSRQSYADSRYSSR